jgi:hypothetical protein
MKETGLAIIASYAIWKLFCLIRNSIKSKKFKIQPYAEQLLILWPAFLAYLLLKILLNVYHMTEWRDVMYNPSNQSSYQIVIDNLAHLKFINTYFTSNITNLFVYYFNWLIPAIILLTSIPLVHWLTKKASKRQKHLLVFWLFISFSYILFVFSFPTWTIVRYIIPVLPFFIILASIGLNVTFKKVSWVIPLVLIVFWFTLGNFSNLDPITNKLNKGSLKSMGESFYAIKFYDNSYERIAYNVKYFKATKNQNNLIKRIYATKTDVFVGDCIDLKLGEKIWSTNVHNKFYPGMNTDIKVRCINHWEIEKYQRLLLGKSIAVPSMDRELIIQKLNMSLKGNFKVVPI